MWSPAGARTASGASSGPAPNMRATPRWRRWRQTSGPRCCNLVIMKEVTSTTLGWFVGRIPDDWFTGPPEITYDRDEILVVGSLAEPEQAKGSDEETRAAAHRARIESFREDT